MIEYADILVALDRKDELKFNLGNITVDAAFDIYMSQHDVEEFTDTLAHVAIRWRQFDIQNELFKGSSNYRFSKKHNFVWHFVIGPHKAGKTYLLRFQCI